MNNLDSALVEMAALAAKWRGENENNFGCFVRSDEQFSGILRGRKMAAGELDALRTRLAGGGDDGRDAGDTALTPEMCKKLVVALNSQQTVKP